MCPDTVLFDLDSTLCRSTQDDATIHADVFDRAGIEPFCDVAAIRETAPEVGDADSDRDYFRRLFARIADKSDAGTVDAEALADATLAVTDASAVEWRPGAKAALEMARERATVGLVTNGSRASQRTKLDVLGIADAFETIVYAGDDSAPKPNPEPFELALEAVDARPGEALYVGNDYRADVVGAKRAGLAACWIPSEKDLAAPPTPSHRPDYRLDSPAELESVL